MKKILTLVLTLTFCLLVAVASAATYELNYSTPLSQEQTSTIMFDEALDKIEEATNGDIHFNRTYSGTLGSEHDLWTLAERVRALTGADLGVGVTGLAGPVPTAPMLLEEGIVQASSGGRRYSA